MENHWKIIRKSLESRGNSLEKSWQIIGNSWKIIGKSGQNQIE